MKNSLRCLNRNEKERRMSVVKNGCTCWWYTLLRSVWISAQRFCLRTQTDFFIWSVNNSYKVKLRALNLNVWIRKPVIFMQSPYRRVYISLALSLHKTIGQWSQTKFPAVEWWMRWVSWSCRNKPTFRAMSLRTDEKSPLRKQLPKNKTLCFNLQVYRSLYYDTERNMWT